MLYDQIYLCDGLDFLKKIERADFIYIDPPYGHGSFGNLDCFFLEKWIKESLRIINNRGILYLHVDYQFISEYHEILPWSYFRGQIIWKNGWVSGYKTKTTKFWPKNHQIILGFAGKDWKWRRLERPKPNNYERKGKPGGTGFVYDDIWIDINPVDSLSFSWEKVTYKTQKPIKLLERLILGSCDEDGLVVDPCFGSGTSMVAAKNLNRYYLGSDNNEIAYKMTKCRLENRMGSCVICNSNTKKNYLLCKSCWILRDANKKNVDI